MNSLKSHVDSMFNKYKENKQIKELKSEVLSNLEAKVDDLITNGMEYNEAVSKAKESINNIDHLIDQNVKVYINKYKLEYIQIVLLYFIIAWIITIPLGIIGEGGILNIVLLISSFTIGIWYILLNKKGEHPYSQSTAFINLQFIFKIKKITWIIWLLFILVSTLYTTAIFFGSNIWFSRPIKIMGPYQFAEITIRYMLPFISIIFPLIFNVAPKLISRYEVGENNENKK